MHFYSLTCCSKCFCKFPLHSVSEFLLFTPPCSYIVVIICIHIFEFFLKADPSKHSSWWRRTEDVFTTSSRHNCKTSWIRLEKDVLEDLLKTFLEDILQMRPENVLKTSWRRLGRQKNVTLKTSWKTRNVFWDVTNDKCNVFQFYIFTCWLWSTSDHYQGDTLKHQVLLTASQDREPWIHKPRQAAAGLALAASQCSSDALTSWSTLPMKYWFCKFYFSIVNNKSSPLKCIY